MKRICEANDNNGEKPGEIAIVFDIMELLNNSSLNYQRTKRKIRFFVSSIFNGLSAANGGASMCHGSSNKSELP